MNRNFTFLVKFRYVNTSRYLLLVCTALLFFVQVHGQNSQGLLLSEGPIPDDFKNLYSTKFQEALDDERLDELKNKKQSKEFAALTNYSIDNLLKSGNVVYGDPISRYCNNLIDKLLMSRNDINVNIRLYTLKSNDVNAYSTHQGIIIITTGLLSRLENEDELAFVLAHEIAHVIENHNVESFDYNSELFKKDVAGNELEEKVLKSAKHSKKSEFEADDLGFELFTAAGYNTLAIMGTMDKLLYAYLPAKQQYYDYSAVETDEYQFSERDKTFEEEKIEAEEDVDDSKSTHPNIKRRKENILSKIIEGKYDTTQNLIVSSKFKQIKSIAYKESIYQYVIHHQYVEALMLIDAIDTEMSLYQQSINRLWAMSYYGIQSFVNEGQKTDILDYDKLQGPQLSYFKLFKRLNRNEINVLSVRQIGLLYKKNLNDTILGRLFEQSLSSMATHTSFNTKYFSRAPDSSKLKKANKKCYTCYTAFNDFKDKEDLMVKLKEYRKTVQKEEEYYVEEIGASKLVMLSPRYYGIDNRETANKKFLKGEKKNAYIEKKIVDYGNQLSINVDIIDSWKNGDMNTESMNQYIIIMDWLKERSGYSGECFKGIMYEPMNDIRRQYNTDYLGFSMYWNILERKEFNALYCVGGVLTVYGLPIYLKWQLTPYHYTGYNFVLLNAETGQVAYVDAKLFNVRYRNYLLNAHLYNSLNQIAK
jgi:hypothetical protein